MKVRNWAGRDPAHHQHAGMIGRIDHTLAGHQLDEIRAALELGNNLAHAAFHGLPVAVLDCRK